MYVNFPQWSRPFSAPNSIVCEPAKVVQKLTLVFNSEGRELPSWFDRIEVMFDKVIILTDQLDNPFYLNQGNTISTKDGVKDWAPNLLDELTPGPVIFVNNFPLNKWR